MPYQISHTPDEFVDRLLKQLRDQQDPSGNLELLGLKLAYWHFNAPAFGVELQLELLWARKRWRLFTKLCRREKIRYARAFIGWCEAELNTAAPGSHYLLHPVPLRPPTENRISCLFYLCPRIALFVRNIRRGVGTDNLLNWRHWNAREWPWVQDLRHPDPYVQAEHRLLDHVLRYECLGEPLLPRLPRYPRRLPFISEILRPVPLLAEHACQETHELPPIQN
ncbi:hypothetical protein F4804DRAFT_137918 [Jackrogersella minutella]|nr:hypothetical protein F4804DRAFT_137918 [Jackrogersella minutella]